MSLNFYSSGLFGAASASQTVIHTVGYGNVVGADGWSKVSTVQDGVICPAVVNKYNWDKAAAGKWADSTDEFIIKQEGNNVQARRVGVDDRWGLNLAFACRKADASETPASPCHTVVVGTSHEAEWTKEKEWSKAYAIPNGYICPAEVTKVNWSPIAAGMHAEVNDVFRLRQDGNSFTVSRQLNRKWGIVLAFDCCKAGETAYEIEDKCHPSKSCDWDCSAWCSCFEQSVEDADEYDPKCMDGTDNCAC